MRTLSIGRADDNDIILNDVYVSRKHAQLIIENGQALIRDLGAANGTFVNGNRVTSQRLEPGDIVKCGSVFLNWSQYAGNFFPEAEAGHRPVSGLNSPAGNRISSPHVETTNNSDVHHSYVQNVIVVGKVKSVGLAFLLAFLFGPLGLFYASVTGGIVMTLLCIVTGIISFGLSLIFLTPICWIWAIVAASQANTSFRNQAINRNV